MWFPHIAIALVFVLDKVILYFLAIRFRWYAIVCKSSSDVAIYNFGLIPNCKENLLYPAELKVLYWKWAHLLYFRRSACDATNSSKYESNKEMGLHRIDESQS
jgi:hypothetical protein